jgi:hypothetical protein
MIGVCSANISLLGDQLVDLEARLHENEVGALPARRHRRHRRPYPKLAGFVACRRHDAPLAGSADGDRLATEIWIVALLDGCVEGVHIDVDDLPLAGRGDCVFIFLGHA